MGELKRPRPSGSTRPSLWVVNLASVHILLTEKIWSWPGLLISLLDQESQLQEATHGLPLLGVWGVKEEDKWSWFPASGNCSIVRNLEEAAFGFLPHGDRWQSVSVLKAVRETHLEREDCYRAVVEGFRKPDPLDVVPLSLILPAELA